MPPDAPFDSVVTDLAALRDLYRPPHEKVARKKIDHVDAGAAAMIAASPFVLVSTSGADGRCAVSPRGGEPGFVRVLDPHRLALPDYPGNNLIDGLQHLVSNPHVGLLFLFPGSTEVLRVAGRAWVTTDDAVLERSADAGRRPVAAIGVAVESVFVHCPASLRRGGVWDPETWGRVPVPTTAEVYRGHIALTDPAVSPPGGGGCR